MIKHLFLLITVLIFTFSCKSTYTKIGDKNANYIPYYLKVYEADSLYIVENYEKSFKILDSLFKKYEPVNTYIYYEVINYMKLKVILNKRISRKETENWILNYGVTLLD